MRESCHSFFLFDPIITFYLEYCALAGTDRGSTQHPLYLKTEDMLRPTRICGFVISSGAGIAPSLPR